MKKLVLLLAFGLVITAAVQEQAAGQNAAERAAEQYPDKETETIPYANSQLFNLYAPQNAAVKDGPQVEYHPDGEIKAKLNFKNGQYDGLQQFFNESGILVKESNFDGGVTNGEQKLLDEQGRLLFQWTERNGKRDGTYRGYFTDGTLAQESQYSLGLFLDKDGKPYNGKYTVNCRDGSPYIEEEYKNGILFGAQTAICNDDY